MGIFDCFFKKKGAAVTTETEKMVEHPVSAPEVSATVRIETKDVECESATKLSCLDFGKPEGELGRYLNYRRYKITGTDERGKRSLKIRTGVDAQQAIEKVAALGLLPPFDVAPLEYESPTDRQLDYLKNLGVFIPVDITKDDAGYMIGRAIGEDSMEGPSPVMVALAAGLKTEFSAFVGASGLFCSIIRQANDRDLAALYAYGVRQNIRKCSFGNMIEDPALPIFYAFADQVLSDPALMRSLKGRSADDFRSPHHGTAIYRAAVAHLTSHT